MFENYTVTASRHPSSLPICDEGLFGPGWAVPRTSSPCESLNHQTSITQLSQQFSELRHTSQPSTFAESHRTLNTNNELTAAITTAEYVGSFSPSRRRVQRQHGVRMLCDPSHLRNIQEMVDRMVRSGDQCAVSPPRASSAEPSNSDDEGYSSFDENHRNGSISSVSSSGSGPNLTFKRSADSITGACVSKNVRVRKARNLRGYPKP